MLVIAAPWPPNWGLVRRKDTQVSAEDASALPLSDIVEWWRRRASIPRFILIYWVLFHDITPKIRRGFRDQIDTARSDVRLLLWRPRFIGSGGCATC